MMRLRLLPVLRHSAITLALCMWLAGCAELSGVQDSGPPFRDPAMSMQGASDSVKTGKTTKADVLAALGPATVVTFDTGYEVWVYRDKSREPPATRAEFVVLFTPDGLVGKSRLRLAPTSAR